MALVGRVLSICSIGTLFCATAIFGCFVQIACAQTGVSAPSSEQVDAIVIMDSSASMRVTDPSKLRNEGARLFIQFLSKGDNLGIIEFSDQAKIIRQLSEYDPSQEQQVRTEIEAVGDTGLFTDPYAAIKLAADTMQSSGRSDAEKIIILLSDGMLEPDPKTATTETRSSALFNELIPDLKSWGIKIHTIGFSDKADQELLKQIAVAADGVNFFAPNAEDIHKYFAELFLAAKRPQVLPLTSKGFKVDASIEEATFYINREGETDEIRLVAPSGRIITSQLSDPAFRWFKGSKFDVVTITKPEAGDWRIDGLPSRESFATVLTNLRLVADWPTTLFEGNPVVLEARLFEGTKPVELQQMLEEVAYGVRIIPTDRVSEPVVIEKLVDDGTNGDRVKNDGVYSLKITLDEPGEYRLELLARAPTFERKQQVMFRVKPRLVSLSVEQAEDAEKGEVFRVALSPDADRLRGVEIKLVATDSDRRRITLPVKAVTGKGNVFEASTSLLPKEGLYSVQATMSADGRKGKVTDTSLIIEYQKGAGEAAEGSSVVIVEEEHKEEVEEKPAGFPILGLLLIIVLQGGVSAFSILRLKKSAQGSMSTAPELPDIALGLEAIQLFEQTVARREIPLNDPLVADNSLEFHLREQDRNTYSASGGVASGAVSAATKINDTAAPTESSESTPDPVSQNEASIPEQAEPPAAEAPATEQAAAPETPDEGSDKGQESPEESTLEKPKEES